MDLRIILNSSTFQYYSGQTIIGRALIRHSLTDISQPVSSALQVIFKGEAKIGWSGGNETYFHNIIPCDIYQESGVEEIPFHFTLPLNIPPSFKGSHGSIEYQVTVAVYRDRGNGVVLEQEVTQQFYVYSRELTEIILVPGQTISTKKSEKIGLFWWSGPVFAHLTLLPPSKDKKEWIRFSAQVVNDSKSALSKPKVLLVQEVTYRSEPGGGDMRVESIILDKVKSPQVPGAGRTIQWEDGFPLPATPPTLIHHLCSLIQITYSIMLVVDGKWSICGRVFARLQLPLDTITTHMRGRSSRGSNKWRWSGMSSFSYSTGDYANSRFGSLPPPGVYQNHVFGSMEMNQNYQN